MSGRNQQRNPYIIGRPIDEEEFFFGREGLFGFIEDNLVQNVKVILLHGQRRIGKSSVLRQIPLFFQQREFNEFVFVNFDLQDKASLSLSQILHSLATEILDLECLEHLNTENSVLLLLSATELEANIFSQNFLARVHQELREKNLVLLLDEFDVLSDDVHTQGEERQADMHFFAYLKELIEQHEKLFIIPVVGRSLNDMPKLLHLFGHAPVNEIGLLEELSAKRLISKPARDQLEYDQDAIKAILDLSAGHPYFTQVICHAVFQQARDENKSHVTPNDVNNIVTKAIESAEGGLDWYWKGLPTQEQVVFSAVAQAQSIAIANSQRLPEDPLVLLKSYGVQTESLNQAANQLSGANKNNSFLDDTGRRVKVELVRRWLIKRHPLRQAILELETLEQEEINRLLEEAKALRQRGETQNALGVYEQILTLNPNHFSTVANLAQGYLEVKEIDKAVELYTRAFQVDPARNKDGLLRALTTYGENLFAQRDLTQAKEQFNRVLKIEPGHQLAQKKLQEISHIEASAATQGSLQPALPSEWIVPHLRWRIPIRSTAAVIGIIALAGIGVYRVSTPCSAGQQKVFYVGCKLDERKISRGERTFFINIKNPARDQGLQAFQEAKYSKAEEFFKRALTVQPSQPKDPEVLIYYNNARAKQQGNPFTLAVVVPAKQEDQAQEILRGVAQAQNQFNEKGGLNGQLLEIAIASDDDNTQDIAKKVAEKLVKYSDSSVLAVIGHNTSDATKEALDTYRNANLAIISPTSTSTLLNDSDNGVFFRTVPSDAATGEKLATYAKKSLGINNVVIFYNSGNSYSNSLREEFTKKFEEPLRNRVVKKIDLKHSKLNEWKDELENSVYQQDNAQAAVLFPGTESTSKALEFASLVAEINTKLKNRTNNQGRKELKLLGGDALYSDKNLQQGEKSIEGLILAVPWFREAPQSKNFAQAAQKQWGGPVSWRTATSFDATQALIKALRPSANRSTVMINLKNQDLTVKASETSGETLQFDSEGERQNKPVLVKVFGGKFKLVQE
ncbi:ABC transporter substrate-binding protein [Brasilonema sp. UFV-L1]|uniref:ABC transporter substrate-binding protein n=1 Tax=Brasilonema sp. UFV-L1 TaxID=2234130 RepID=UPI00145D5B43|nr:ABC transporter substrate-binding protein [Brasilonema sp. UFV-L1]NMG08272.1 branched-chain amino acid ABC transporter substrate-binding protein [Brasilonema sp. UFV-L1]